MRKSKILNLLLVLFGVALQSQFALGDDLFDPRVRCSTQIVQCPIQDLESRCISSDEVSNEYLRLSGYQECCFWMTPPKGFRQSCTPPQCKQTVTSKCPYGCSLKTSQCASSHYTEMDDSNTLDLLVCRNQSGGLLSNCGVYNKSFVAKGSFPAKVTFQSKEYHFQSLLQKHGVDLEIDSEGNTKPLILRSFAPAIDLNIDWSKQSSCLQSALWENGTHGFYSVDLNDPAKIRKADGRFLAIGEFDYEVPFDTYNRGMLRVKETSDSTLAIEVGFQVNEFLKQEQVAKQLTQSYSADGTSGVWDTIIKLGTEVLSSESKLLSENGQVPPSTFADASIGTKRFIASMVQVADQKNLVSVDSDKYWASFLEQVGYHYATENYGVPLDGNQPAPSAPFDVYYNPNLTSHLYLPDEIILPYSTSGIPADCHINLSDVEIAFDREQLIHDANQLEFFYIASTQSIREAESLHNYYIGGEDSFWGAILALAESLWDAQGLVLSWDELNFQSRRSIQEAINNAIGSGFISATPGLTTWELFKDKAACYGPGGECIRPSATEAVAYVVDDGTVNSVRINENAATYFREKRNLEKLTGTALLILEIANRYGYDVSQDLDWFIQD